MRLGFCTMGYLDYTTVEEAIRRIAKLGYEVVDFWAYSPHLGPDLYDKQKRHEIKQLVEEVGLAVAGSLSERRWFGPPSELLPLGS